MHTVSLKEKVKNRRHLYIISNIYSLIGLLAMGMNIDHLLSIGFLIGLVFIVTGIAFGEYIWRCPKCNLRLDPKDYNPKSCGKCKISF